MPVLPRHTGVIWTGNAVPVFGGTSNSGGQAVINVWGYQTVAGTANYNMFDTHGSPHNNLFILNAYLNLNGAPGVGDTVVLNHISTAGAVNAITDTIDLTAFVDHDQVDFTSFDNTYSLITKGENLRITTASGALAIVFVEFCIA
jgi:hypothetical protein